MRKRQDKDFAPNELEKHLRTHVPGVAEVCATLMEASAILARTRLLAPTHNLTREIVWWPVVIVRGAAADDRRAVVESWLGAPLDALPADAITALVPGEDGDGCETGTLDPIAWLGVADAIARRRISTAALTGLIVLILPDDDALAAVKAEVMRKTTADIDAIIAGADLTLALATKETTQSPSPTKETALAPPSGEVAVMRFSLAAGRSALDPDAIRQRLITVSTAHRARLERQAIALFDEVDTHIHPALEKAVRLWRQWAGLGAFVWVVALCGLAGVAIHAAGAIAWGPFFAWWLEIPTTVGGTTPVPWRLVAAVAITGGLVVSGIIWIKAAVAALLTRRLMLSPSGRFSLRSAFQASAGGLHPLLAPHLAGWSGRQRRRWRKLRDTLATTAPPAR